MHFRGNVLHIMIYDIIPDRKMICGTSFTKFNVQTSSPDSLIRIIQPNHKKNFTSINIPIF